MRHLLAFLAKDTQCYVLGLGLGIVPTQVYGTSHSSSHRHYASGGISSKIDALRGTVQQLKEQVQVQENQHQIAFLTQELAN